MRLIYSADESECFANNVKDSNGVYVVPAFLAGLAVGFWKDQSVLISDEGIDQVFTPKMPKSKRIEYYKGWKKAVKRSLKWEEEN